jgi:hypothetical protein
MRRLLKFTVATAIELKLIDLALQVVDGTKITANAARDRTYDAAELQRLLERTEAAIIEMETQNEAGMMYLHQSLRMIYSKHRYYGSEFEMP